MLQVYAQVAHPAGGNHSMKIEIGKPGHSLEGDSPDRRLLRKSHSSLVK
jgi:hypothetical protein